MSDRDLLGGRIGLVACETLNDPTGIGTYTRQLAARLPERIADFRCIHAAAPEVETSGTVQVLPPLLRPALPRKLLGPLWCSALGYDLLHFPTEMSMFLWKRRRTRLVVTVHGLASVRLPAEMHERLPRRAQRKYRHLLEGADRIITVSESSKRDIIDVYQITSDRIVVVYNGIDEAFRDDAPVGPPPDVDRPYVLSVCATIPKKNVAAVIRMLAALRERGLPHVLVHVGPPGSAQADLEAEVRRFHLRDAVTFKGYVSKEDLAAYYRSAAALVFPSFHEGFGIPIVEAMASGCPVITSTAYSMPEVAGDAALLVDPYDVESLIAVGHRLLTNTALREEMIGLGRQRARRFSWNRCADETAAVYAEVLEGGR